MALFQKKVVDSVSKTLTITMVDKHNPTYDFVGDWTGKDIMDIGRTIARAYRTKQRGIRRELALDTEVSEQPITAMEELK